MENTDILIDCQSVWKVFGDRSREAIGAITGRGLGKQEVLIRIGDRIAIMKDGVIIQTGTAEDIVMNPADQYVADFVAGISRLHLVKAHSVMVPATGPVDGLPRCSPEADIDALIGQITETGSDAIAVEDQGRVVGVVTTRNLLLGVRGDAAAAAH